MPRPISIPHAERIRLPKDAISDRLYNKERIPVRTGDGYVFYTEIEALKVSSVLKTALQNRDSEPLLIQGFDHDIVQRVLWWMTNHIEDNDLKENDYIDEEMDAWQRCFFSTTIDIVLKLVSAANYLEIRRLLDLGINKLAELINSRMSDENPVRAIRDAFHMRAPDPMDSSKNEQIVNEKITRLFVFEQSIKSKEKRSKIDVLNVEVTHLPPRKLEPPENTDSGGPVGGLFI